MLGYNFLNILNVIMFQSLPISTLYDTIMAALLDDVFKFAIIAEYLELKLTEFIFTILMPGPLFMYSFLLNGVDHAAPGTPTYIFKMVELATFVAPLSIHQASSQFVFLSAVFTSSSCGECVCCGVLSVCLTAFCTIASKLFVSCKLLITADWALLPRLAHFHYVW